MCNNVSIIWAPDAINYIGQDSLLSLFKPSTPGKLHIYLGDFVIRGGYLVVGFGPFIMRGGIELEAEGHNGHGTRQDGRWVKMCSLAWWRRHLERYMGDDNGRSCMTWVATVYGKHYWSPNITESSYSSRLYRLRNSHTSTAVVRVNWCFWNRRLGLSIAGEGAGEIGVRTTKIQLSSSSTPPSSTPSTSTNWPTKKLVFSSKLKVSRQRFMNPRNVLDSGLSVDPSAEAFLCLIHYQSKNLPHGPQYVRHSSLRRITIIGDAWRTSLFIVTWQATSTMLLRLAIVMTQRAMYVGTAHDHNTVHQNEIYCPVRSEVTPLSSSPNLSL